MHALITDMSFTDKYRLTRVQKGRQTETTVSNVTTEHNVILWDEYKKKTFEMSIFMLWSDKICF
jgi:hypothetical protein